MAAAPDLLTFVETTVFTKRVTALGLEESLQMLQQELIANPEAGDLEPVTIRDRVSGQVRAFTTAAAPDQELLAQVEQDDSI